MVRIINLKCVCIPLVIVFVWFFCLGHCHSQYVTFEVLNGEFDDAIFVGERNVTLQCCVTDFMTLGAIQIKHLNGDRAVVRNNNGQSNCTEYTISEVQDTNDGNYSCTANYTCMDGRGMSKELRLYLNVPVIDSVPKCVRNGTYGEPYKSGDWVRLSCYCRLNDGCMWISTVPGSGTAHMLDMYTSYDHKGITVLQVVVNIGTNSTNPINTRYDCFYGETSPQRCSIGPASVSTNAIVTTAIMESDHCLATKTMTSKNNVGTTNDADHTQMGAMDGVNNMAFDESIIIFIAVGIIVVIVIILVVILIIVCRRRPVEGHSDGGDDTTFGFKNNACSADDDGGKSPYYHANGQLNTGSATTGDRSNIIVTGNSAMDHTYDAPPLTDLETSENDLSDTPVDDYAEIGDSRSRMRNQEMNPDLFRREESSNRDSASGYIPVNRKEVPSEPAEDSDFNGLYAKVNKTKTSES